MMWIDTDLFLAHYVTLCMGIIIGYALKAFVFATADYMREESRVRTEKLLDGIGWVLNDATYKAPEQVTPECRVWIDRLQSTLDNYSSDPGQSK